MASGRDGVRGGRLGDPSAVIDVDRQLQCERLRGRFVVV
jgi:hypothetical protein